MYHLPFESWLSAFLIRDSWYILLSVVGFITSQLTQSHRTPTVFFIEKPGDPAGEELAHIKLFLNLFLTYSIRTISSVGNRLHKGPNDATVSAVSLIL